MYFSNSFHKPAALCHQLGYEVKTLERINDFEMSENSFYYIPLQPLRAAISQSQSWKDIDSWCWHFPRENHPGVKFCVTTDVVYFAFSFL